MRHVSDTNRKNFSNVTYNCIKFYSLDLSVSTEEHIFMLEIIILNQTIEISKSYIYESSRNHFENYSFENMYFSKSNF